MFLFPINSHQSGLSYFYPGILGHKRGFISLYVTQGIFKILILFSIIDVITIGFCFAFKDTLPTIIWAFIAGLQLMLFSCKNFLLSREKVKIAVNILDTHSVAPLFYWVTHFLMAFSVIYTVSVLENHASIFDIPSSLRALLKILQFVFWLIFMSPVINLILTKIRQLTKWI